jgi:excisionase family DNA binding protein
MSTELHELNTVEEARCFLRCSRWKIYDLIRSGALASTKVGNSRLIPRRELERLATPVAAAR